MRSTKHHLERILSKNILIESQVKPRQGQFSVPWAHSVTSKAQQVEEILLELPLEGTEVDSVGSKPLRESENAGEWPLQSEGTTGGHQGPQEQLRFALPNLSPVS